MKKIIIISIIVLAVLGVGILLAVYGNNTPATTANKGMNVTFTGTDEEAISPEGIHWHPNLTIYIKGKKQDIPTNIGVGSQYSGSRFYDSMMSMTDIHTHDGTGELHWEVMQGPTKRGYLRLGNFFEIWGKPFNQNQILDYINGEQGKVKMTVNGKENTEFENYHIQDKDQIEIRFE